MQEDIHAHSKARQQSSNDQSAHGGQEFGPASACAGPAVGEVMKEGFRYG
jgi:hypothetical protein